MDVDLSHYYKRTIVKHQVSSRYLQEDRAIRVFLPPGYNELLSYPVVYCQDGEQFFNFGRIATLLSRGILEDGFEPAIVVGVDVDTATRTSEYAPEGELHAAYMSFWYEELVPWVEANYPARTNREERILAGDSLGATVSLHLAIHYRGLFRNVLSFSGAFLASTRGLLYEQTDLSWLRMYMLIGLDETEVTTGRGTFDFLAENRATRDLLQHKNAELLYLEKPGKHIWGFWQQELPEALAYFLKR